MEQFAELGCVC